MFSTWLLDSQKGNTEELSHEEEHQCFSHGIFKHTRPREAQPGRVLGCFLKQRRQQSHGNEQLVLSRPPTTF